MVDHIDSMQNGTELPDRIFFTGVPGSRWSGIAQTLEQIPGFNTSDRSDYREYKHGKFSGHKGAYFGTGMEFNPILDKAYLDQAWKLNNGCKLIKSHEWAYQLDEIKQVFPKSWILLVYRPNIESFNWWQQAGGFSIKYPNYDWYVDNTKMMYQIESQNKYILDFASRHNLKWSSFNKRWIQDTFNQDTECNEMLDVFVTILK